MFGRIVAFNWLLFAVQIVFIISLTDFTRTSYGDHVFPKHVDGIGWMIAGAEVLLVLVVAVYRICTTEVSSRRLYYIALETNL